MPEDPLSPRLTRLIALADHPVVKGVVPVVIVGVAVYALHRLSTEVSLSDVRRDLAAAPPATIQLALACTTMSFVGLALYDPLAARIAAPGAIPARVALMTCATGYALTNLLGFSYVTGTAVRYRVYTGYGVEMARVALILVYSWMAFWAGVLAMTGGLMVFHPAGLSTVLPIPASAETAAGLAMLALLAGALAVLRFGPRRLTLLGRTFDLPRPGDVLAMIGAAGFDLIGASLTLYVLMPADLVPSYPYLFVIYIAAIVLGLVSHAPGGIGVFEVTVIGALGAAGRSDALAALLLYRVVYTGMPFLVAVTGLAVAELRSRRRALVSAVGQAQDLVQPFAPLLASAVALAAGTVLLTSGNLPSADARMELVRSALPLAMVEASHLAGSVAGVLLLVVARGLYRRLYSAWALALGLLTVGVVASLVKGLDIDEALALAFGTAVLALFRPAFHRVDRSAPLHLGAGWFVSVAALFAALTWIGFFAFKHVEYQSALWWQVSWSGDASRFLRASLAGAVVLAALALNSLLGARGRRHRPEGVPDAVRALIASSGDSAANIALLGDKSFLIAADARAYLAYADTGAALVSQGDPIGDEEAARQLLWQLREQADHERKRAVFYGVSPRFVASFLDMGLAVVKFGEVARVDLHGFSLDTPGMKGRRQARNRAMREGYRFDVVPPLGFAAILPDLRAVSDAWLQHKQGREKGFALGAFDAGYLANFETAVLRAPGDDGRIVAFANLLRGGAVECSADLMRHDPEAPGFVMDALFAEVLLWAGAQGFRWFHLGAAPFSGSETRALASPWQRLGGFVYAHGDEIYHFEGLRAFKDKFQPVWTPNYIACDRGFGVARAFMDANLLISGGVAGLMRKGGGG